MELDPYGTGFIGKDEFREVMTELCVHLSDYELELLCQKFDLRDDGRYVMIGTDLITNITHIPCILLVVVEQKPPTTDKYLVNANRCYQIF